MNIIKRNGSESTFSKNKIIKALMKANDSMNEMDRIPSSQLKKIADTVGIDRINVFEKDEDGKFLPPKDIDFSEWNNTFFKYEHTPDDDDDPGSGPGESGGYQGR